MYKQEPSLLQVAHAFESIIDEVIFIIGPAFTIGASVALFPEAGPIVAMLFLLFGTFMLTSRVDTEPIVDIQKNVRRFIIKSSSLRIVVLVLTAVGSIFGAIDVAVIAYASKSGSGILASIMLSLYAAGACVAGVCLGALPLRGSAAQRLLAGVIFMFILAIPLMFASNSTLLAVMLFFAGLPNALTISTSMLLVGQAIPSARLTEAMTWASTGITIGVALGAGVGGMAIDIAGDRAAFAVALASGVIAIVVTVGGYRTLSRTGA
ncbi:MFS transporter [Streptomyces sp. NPDC007355]|uniref:MFS transporter n=1 Tax=Streptomyces sp. NPDC007355 TaxID=3364778 RepID=UPI003675D7E0